MVKKKSLKKNQKGGDGNHNIQSVGMPIQYFGGDITKYYPAGSPELKSGNSAYGPIVAKSFGTYDPTLTCGSDSSTAPQLAPYPNSTTIQTGGLNKKAKKAKKAKKSKKKSRKSKKGGDGNHNIQSVGMPIQYFGGDVTKYYPSGSPELQPGTGAYGPIVAKSFGTYDPTLTCGNDSSTAPNLSPYPNSTGIQTGGNRKKNRKNKKK